MIIFAVVIIISAKAISRGIDAKQNMKEKVDNEETVISSTDEKPNYSIKSYTVVIFFNIFIHT